MLITVRGGHQNTDIRRTTSPRSLASHPFELSEELYPKVFAEMHRLLRTGGVAVVLTTNKLLVTDVVLAQDGRDPRERRQIFLGGLKAYVHVIAKRERERAFCIAAAPFHCRLHELLRIKDDLSRA